MIRIKNWARFQHYTHRRPPWIKLYRDLLDDPDFHALPAEHAKALVFFWLIASEQDGTLPKADKLAFRLRISIGQLRAHIAGLSAWLETDCKHDASNMLAPCKQHATPEREGEGEGYSYLSGSSKPDPVVGDAPLVPPENAQKPPLPPSDAPNHSETPPALPKRRTGASRAFAGYSADFCRWWAAYPRRRRVGKMAAFAKWESLRKSGTLPPIDRMMDAIDRHAHSQDWMKDGGNYVPAPLVYLNQGRWDDYEEVKQ